MATIITMSKARFIVCEKRGFWAAAFRRSLAEAGVRVYETRSLPECEEDCARFPASFVALQATPRNLDRLLETLLRLTSRPTAAAIVLGDRELSGLEFVWREAGALHVVHSPRRVAPAARMIARYMAALPEEPLTPLERIYRDLPWAADA